MSPDLRDKFTGWTQENDPGFQLRYHQRGGGYYFNVGCSELIMQGKVMARR